MPLIHFKFRGRHMRFLSFNSKRSAPTCLYLDCWGRSIHHRIPHSGHSTKSIGESDRHSFTSLFFYLQIIGCFFFESSCLYAINLCEINLYSILFNASERILSTVAFNGYLQNWNAVDGIYVLTLFLKCIFFFLALCCRWRYTSSKLVNFRLLRKRADFVVYLTQCGSFRKWFRLQVSDVSWAQTCGPE